jgi:hypothetical protein
LGIGISCFYLIFGKQIGVLRSKKNESLAFYRLEKQIALV